MYGRKLLVFLVVIYQVMLATPAEATGPDLVETEWLAKNLNNPDIVLIDMSDSLQYQRFHLPGAVNLPYEYLNQSKNRVSLSIGSSQVSKLLGKLGITKDSYVIMYDDTGGLNASRLFWELERLGHPKASILNGGLVKWIREGRKVSHDSPVLKSSTYTPIETSVQHSVATLGDVSPATRDKKAFLLDVRSPDEYLGNPRFPRSGHIPGAVHWQWDQALDIDNGFTLHDKVYLTNELGKIGLKDKQQPVIVYCHSGHRASHTYFTLRQLGFKNIRLYDGSMKEYEQQKALPLKMGKEP